MTALTHRHLRFAEFEFDPKTLELWRGGDPVHLPRQPARFLALLLTRPGDLVTRDELREALWGQTFVDWEQGLANAARLLRRALGDSADHPRFVETLPTLGYRFIGELAAATAEPALSTTAPDSDPPGGLRLHDRAAAPRSRLRAVLWIAAAVAAGLALATLAEALHRARAADPPRLDAAEAVAPDAEAQRLFSEGRHLLHKGGAQMPRAVERLEAAVALAPDFAPATVALGRALSALPDPGQRARPRALLLARRATALAPRRAEAWQLLGDLLFSYAWRFDDAERAYRTAVELAPGDASAHLALAALLCTRSRFEEARDAAASARAIDPTSRAVAADLVLVDFWRGDLRAALDEARRYAALDPDDAGARTFLVDILEANGLDGEAAREARVVLESRGASDELRRALDGATPARVLERYLRWQLERLAAADPLASDLGGALASLHARLGDRDAAFAALGRARRERSGFVPFAAVDRHLAPLHADPRFAAWLASIEPLPLAPVG